MAQLMIRLAAPNDLEALRDIYRRSLLSNEGDRASLLAHPQALVWSELAISEGRTRVAVDDGRIVGFASLPGPELEDLFVDPDWMRRGIGRALVAEVIAIATGQGLERLEVIANPHALTFYESVGFGVDGTFETEFGPGYRIHIDVKGPMLPTLRG